MSHAAKLKKLLRSVGPSIIVASIVLGPGSVLTSSKVGCEYGYAMLWVLAIAVVLMIGMTALGTYLGATNRRTPCDELAARAGRPAAAAMGILVFAIIACFQSSNNAAVLASLEGFASEPQGESVSHTAKVTSLLVLNGLIIAAIYGYRSLYRPLERLMVGLVFAMLIAFGVNLAFAGPSLSGVVRGFVPSLPATDTSSGSARQSMWALLGLVATTFSVAGAFYQCYLVREKGWTTKEVRQGLFDSFLGISLLGLVSASIMITSAAALHGQVAVDQLDSTAAIARQLEPFFGASATLLFSFGIFAAAFSSFLGNALVGGTVLADGLGLGSSIDEVWPKRLTVLALLVGMTIACYTTLSGNSAVNVIVLAQALTVLGVPAIAVLMLWLGCGVQGQERKTPAWVLMLAAAGGVVTCVLAVRTAIHLLDVLGLAQFGGTG